MVRYRGPKNRIARRFGANIFGRLRNPLLHKPNPPGMHGASRKKKSDYGLQLEEKQKLRALFGMVPHKQMLRYYQEAVQRQGNTSHLFVEALASRLDYVVYKLKLSPTIFHAQQLVSHGLILVNGKRVDIRSFRVKPGMKISLKEKMKNNTVIQQAIQNNSQELPEYLSFDEKKCEGEFLSVPQFDQLHFPLPINVPLVCEFLAHTA